MAALTKSNQAENLVFIPPEHKGGPSNFKQVMGSILAKAYLYDEENGGMQDRMFSSSLKRDLNAKALAAGRALPFPRNAMGDFVTKPPLTRKEDIPFPEHEYDGDEEDEEEVDEKLRAFERLINIHTAQQKAIDRHNEKCAKQLAQHKLYRAEVDAAILLKVQTIISVAKGMPYAQVPTYEVLEYLKDTYGRSDEAEQRSLLEERDTRLENFTSLAKFSDDNRRVSSELHAHGITESSVEGVARIKKSIDGNPVFEKAVAHYEGSVLREDRTFHGYLDALDKYSRDHKEVFNEQTISSLYGGSALAAKVEATVTTHASSTTTESRSREAEMEKTIANLTKRIKDLEGKAKGGAAGGGTYLYLHKDDDAKAPCKFHSQKNKADAQHTNEACKKGK